MSNLTDTSLVVLCLNDFPIGVYTSTDAADKAARADWEKREQPNAPWKPKGMKLGECYMQGSGVFTCYHYHQHEFTVDAEARL